MIHPNLITLQARGFAAAIPFRRRITQAAAPATIATATTVRIQIC